MEKMWNLGISFQGYLAFEGKSLQFWGEIHHSMDMLVFFLQKNLKMCKKFTFLTQFLTIFPGKFCIFSRPGGVGEIFVFLMQIIHDGLIQGSLSLLLLTNRFYCLLSLVLLCVSIGKRIFSTAHKGELAEKTLPEIVEYAR